MRYESGDQLDAIHLAGMVMSLSGGDGVTQDARTRWRRPRLSRSDAVLRERAWPAPLESLRQNLLIAIFLQSASKHVHFAQAIPEMRLPLAILAGKQAQSEPHYRPPP